MVSNPSRELSSSQCSFEERLKTVNIDFHFALYLSFHIALYTRKLTQQKSRERCERNKITLCFTV